MTLLWSLAVSGVSEHCEDILIDSLRRGGMGILCWVAMESHHMFGKSDFPSGQVVPEVTI